LVKACKICTQKCWIQQARFAYNNTGYSRQDTVCIQKKNIGFSRQDMHKEILVTAGQICIEKYELQQARSPYGHTG
jgi:hypothetical protein